MDIRRDYEAEMQVGLISWLTWRLLGFLFLCSIFTLVLVSAITLSERLAGTYELLGQPEWTVTLGKISAGALFFLGGALVASLCAYFCFFMGSALSQLKNYARWATILVILTIAVSVFLLITFFSVWTVKLAIMYTLFLLLPSLVLLHRLLFRLKPLFEKSYVEVMEAEIFREEDKSFEILLDVRGLKTYFHTEEGLVKAVDGVDFRVYRGKTLGVVGESGCGKSVTAMSIMRLLPTPPAEYVSGTIVFKGRNLLELPEEEMRRVRGNDISMIFQEPMTSLNPVFTVGDQIAEPLIFHKKMSREEALERAVQLLDEVGIPAPELRVHEFPHQMSGGMKQRVMIAMALACEPDLLIADEPTTALDVTIQAQILELMQDLQKRHQMSIILITHDLSVVAEMADHVVVMYAGKVVEYADCLSLFDRKLHPYTIGLFNSIPKLGLKKERLDTIPGMVPNPLDFPSGCRFAPRCPFATSQCSIEPPLEMVEKDHWVACWHVDRVREEQKKREGFAI